MKKTQVVDLSLQLVSYFIPSLFLPSLQYCNTGHWSHFGFFAVQ